MSVSASASSRAEPNLTPLLDIVLQLLMFFMMCVNFVSEQINENIKLPVAQSARPMNKSETDILYLNLNGEGKLEVPGQEPLATPVQMRVYLRGQHEDAQRLARDRGNSEEVKTSIVIRADRSVEYKDVYQLMRMCKEIGYRRFQVRAMTEGKGPDGPGARS